MNNETTPVPVPIGDPVPMKPKEARSILSQITRATLFTLGGLMAFAAFVAPARVSGATRSSKIKWQERECEIQKAINAEASANNPVSTAPRQSDVPPASSK